MTPSKISDMQLYKNHKWRKKRVTSGQGFDIAERDSVSTLSPLKVGYCRRNIRKSNISKHSEISYHFPCFIIIFACSFPNIRRQIYGDIILTLYLYYNVMTNRIGMVFKFN